MRTLTTLAWALLLGLVGFVVVEVGGRVTGTMTAMTGSLVADAATSAFTTLLLTLLFHRWFARARAWVWPLAVLGFVMAFGPLVGVLAAAVELTLVGGWGASDAVRSTFIQTPINAVYTLAVELPIWSLPAGAFVAGLLALRIRRIEARRGRLRYGSSWR